MAQSWNISKHAHAHPNAINSSQMSAMRCSIIGVLRALHTQQSKAGMVNSLWLSTNLLRPSIQFHIYLSNCDRQLGPENQSHQFWDWPQLHSLYILELTGSDFKLSGLFRYLHACSLYMSRSFFLCCGPEDHHCALHVCWCVWEEIGVIVLFLQRSSRKKQRLQPKATWADVSKRVCTVVYGVLYWCASAVHMWASAFFFPHIHPASLGFA